METGRLLVGRISTARDLLSGLTIALIIHSLDPSLTTQSIANRLLDRSTHPTDYH